MIGFTGSLVLEDVSGFFEDELENSNCKFNHPVGILVSDFVACRCCCCFMLSSTSSSTFTGFTELFLLSFSSCPLQLRSVSTFCGQMDGVLCIFHSWYMILYFCITLMFCMLKLLAMYCSGFCYVMDEIDFFSLYFLRQDHLRKDLQ